MFKKILVAEDFDTYNVAIAEALRILTPVEPVHVSYCDDALLRIRRSIQENEPFDLLISDLSFKPDHHNSVIQSGMELIEQAKEIDSDLHVIVYSIENRLHPIKHLFDDLGVNGYVLKGRNNIPELRKAIQMVFNGGRYQSEEITIMSNNNTLEEVEEYDITLLSLLARGINQDQISDELQNMDVSPNSKSSVEKRLNRLKTTLGAGNNVQLVLIAKDLGLI